MAAPDTLSDVTDLVRYRDYHDSTEPALCDPVYEDNPGPVREHAVADDYECTETMWPTVMYRGLPSFTQNVVDGVELAQEVTDTQTYRALVRGDYCLETTRVKQYVVNIDIRALVSIRNIAEKALGTTLASFSSAVGCQGIDFTIGCGTLTVLAPQGVFNAVGGRIRLLTWITDLKASPGFLELRTRGAALAVQARLTLTFTRRA